MVVPKANDHVGRRLTSECNNRFLAEVFKPVLLHAVCRGEHKLVVEKRSPAPIVVPAHIADTGVPREFVRSHVVAADDARVVGHAADCKGLSRKPRLKYILMITAG